MLSRVLHASRRGVAPSAHMLACSSRISSNTALSMRTQQSLRTLPRRSGFASLSTPLRSQPAATSTSASSSSSSASSSASAATATPAPSVAAPIVPPASMPVPAVPFSTRLNPLPPLRRWAGEINRAKWSNALLAAGVSFVAYEIFSFGFRDLTEFYLEQRPADAPFLAFLTGVGCTGLSLALYKVTRRMYALRAARAYRRTLRAVWGNDEVRERLGGDVRARTIARMQRHGRIHLWEQAGSPSAATAAGATGDLPRTVAPHYRAVSYLPAGWWFRPSRDGWPRYWRARTLQFSFHVVGSRGSGLVQAAVESPLRSDEGDHPSVLTVELLDQGEQIVIMRAAGSGDAGAPTRRKHDLTEEGEGSVQRGVDLLSKKIVKR